MISHYINLVDLQACYSCKSTTPEDINVFIVIWVNQVENFDPLTTKQLVKH